MKKLLALLFFAASPCFALSEGPNNPATAISSDQGLGSSISWSNVMNSTSSDNTYATAVCSLIGGNFSEYLLVTTFTFVLPGCTSITGITVDIEKKSNGSINDNSVKLVIGGSVTGNEMKDGNAWPASDAYTTYGGATNLWGASPTCAQVQANGLGVAISAIRNSGTSPTASVDHIRMTINYPGAPTAIKVGP